VTGVDMRCAPPLERREAAAVVAPGKRLAPRKRLHEIRTSGIVSTSGIPACYAVTRRPGLAGNHGPRIHRGVRYVGVKT
jgi:hypothetical protein